MPQGARYKRASELTPGDVICINGFMKLIVSVDETIANADGILPKSTLMTLLEHGRIQAYYVFTAASYKVYCGLESRAK